MRSLVSVYSCLFVFPHSSPTDFLAFSSPILPSTSFTLSLPLHQRRSVLNRNSLYVFLDLSWWQPQSTTESIFIPHGNVLSLSLYPQPQFLFISPFKNSTFVLSVLLQVISGAEACALSSPQLWHQIWCFHFHVLQIILFVDYIFSFLSLSFCSLFHFPSIPVKSKFSKFSLFFVHRSF